MGAFSKLYCQPADPQQDSERLRARLAGKFRQLEGRRVVDTECAASIMLIEHGCSVPFYQGPFAEGRDWNRFFVSAPKRDVFDSITAVATSIRNPDTRKEWTGFCARAFREESVAYYVDDDGVVHLHVDAEFRRNVESVIAGLRSIGLIAVENATVAALRKVDSIPLDGKGAIRDVFEAVESMTKHVTNSGSSLTANFVSKSVAPLWQRRLSQDRAAVMASGRVCNSLADWVDAAHVYRHGQEADTAADPPQDLVVVLVSQGLGFVRWLAELCE